MNDDQKSIGDSLLVPDETLAKEAIKDIKKEIFDEQIEMVRDYMKGILRFRNDLEKKIEQVEQEAKSRKGKLQSQMAVIDDVVEKVQAGQFKEMRRVKVPINYLSEKTVRLSGMEWLTGSGAVEQKEPDEKKEE